MQLTQLLVSKPMVYVSAPCSQAPDTFEMGMGGPNMWDLLPVPVDEGRAGGHIKVTPKDASSRGSDSEEEEKMVLTGEDLEFRR